MSAEFLKQSVLFKDFTPVGLNILSGIVRGRVLLAGTPLFAEGAPSEALYLVVEGRLRLAMQGPEGREVAVGSLGAGEHLGQVSLLGEQPVVHLCSAVAELDSKILEIPAAEFRALMKQKPQACMKLVLAIAQDFGQKMAVSGDVLKYVVGRAVGR
jgi:CRP-like cAMP-binding protein